jgi:hypothetical protein
VSGFLEIEIDGVWKRYACRYIDDYHEWIGTGVYHIDKFYSFIFSNPPVNLIRLIHKQVKVGDYYQGRVISSHIEYGEKNEPYSFDRWVDEHIGGFRKDDPKLEEAKEVKLKQARYPLTPPPP